MAPNYVLLQKIEITTAVNTVTFSNIPQTGYTDLKIVASTRNSAQNYGGFYLRFNSSTSSYTQKRLKQEGSSLTSDSSIEIPFNQSSWGSAYGSAEIYIPNYTSSLHKSVLIDGVTENNATTNRNTLGSFLWSNTAAITTISLGTFDNGASDSFIQNSTFSIYGIAALNTTPVSAPLASGGNRITTDGTYWYHTFLTSGYFTPITSLSSNYYVLGGGATGSGGGSSGSGGGGGGGGSSYVTSASLSAQPYPVTVGAGGPTGGSNATGGSVGNNSTFNSTTGGGGQQQASYSVASPGGTGTTQNGGNGGIGYPSGNAQNGGAGYTNPLDSVTRGGGGGGSTKSGTQGTGTNGGGNGVGSGTGGDGTANTGGGGGGSAQDNVGYGGGGGSGIVIIRYAV